MTADDATERARRIVSGAMFGLTTPMMVDAIVSDLADAGLLATTWEPCGDNRHGQPTGRWVGPVQVET